MSAMKKRTDAWRAAYQRLYYECKTSFWTDPVAKDLNWQQYLNMRVAQLRAQFTAAEMARGPYKDHSTFTDRQAYQAKYQKARRLAYIAWRDEQKIRDQYNGDFAAYWTAVREMYLPDFFKHRPADHRPRDVRITRRDRPVAVRLEHDPEPDNQPWILAA